MSIFGKILGHQHNMISKNVGFSGEEKKCFNTRSMNPSQDLPCPIRLLPVTLHYNYNA